MDQALNCQTAVNTDVPNFSQFSVQESDGQFEM